MAQEVKIAGALFSDVPLIRVPDSNDTYHPFVDPSVTTAMASDVATGKVFIAADGTQTTGTASGGGGSSSWLPSSATLVASADETFNLSTDTSYDSWTPSTTNTSIMSAGSLRGACSYTITTDYRDTALIGICLLHTELAYPDGTTYAKGYGLSKTIYGVCLYAPLKLPNYSGNNYYGVLQTSVGYRQSYHTSASVVNVYASGNYSVGPTTCTWSASSDTSTSKRIVGITRPAIYARCNDTFFSTTAAAAVDSANSYVYYKYRIYAMDKTVHPLYAMFDADNGALFTS